MKWEKLIYSYTVKHKPKKKFNCLRSEKLKWKKNNYNYTKGEKLKQKKL